jgi:NADPH:quinone reductase-like Zn-dependent oxidoreductase
VINVVRRDAQVELLKGQGATIVLNSSQADFDQQLHDACHQHNARLAFDAVAGPLTGQLLEALPPDSKVTVYSALSYEAAQAGPDQLIFEGKAVDGFWLGPWITKKNLIQILMLWRRAQKLMSTDLKSEVRAQYPFQEAKKAVQDYQSQMTGGKVLLRP